jgi:hypothetical protein
MLTRAATFNVLCKRRGKVDEPGANVKSPVETRGQLRPAALTVFGRLTLD